MEASDRKSVSETKAIQRHSHPDTTNLQRAHGRDILCRISYLAEMTTRPNLFIITDSLNLVISSGKYEHF